MHLNWWITLNLDLRTGGLILGGFGIVFGVLGIFGSFVLLKEQNDFYHNPNLPPGSGLISSGLYHFRFTPKIHHFSTEQVLHYESFLFNFLFFQTKAIIITVFGLFVYGIQQVSAKKFGLECSLSFKVLI